MKYSDRFIDLLVENGYTTVFYVAGGNIMHLLNSCRTKLECIPVIHEVTAVIAAEYFNEASDKKAFALVTAGPGLTNCVTGIAGAWLESRGVLIVGGQVKSTDLKRDSGVRQNGIQEINGVEIVQSICKKAIGLDYVPSDLEMTSYLDAVFSDRPGPVFLEFCLDIQGADVENLPFVSYQEHNSGMSSLYFESVTSQVQELLNASNRPVVLLGGGVSRETAPAYIKCLETLGIPIMTTWNGADRIDAFHPLYFGRPNTWGQRSSNIILQQADLLIAVGTRLGIQQTGFNWQNFMPSGKIIQVDLDEAEISKGHPVIDFGIVADSKDFLAALEALNQENVSRFEEWVEFARKVRDLCPLNEDVNTRHEGFINPYDFVEKLSAVAPSNAVVIPCSSGGAFTTMMQAFRQKVDQKVITNKGLASMGYGLAGAIGASIACRDRVVILVEGDGGFAQNLQDIGTLLASGARVKIFIYSNEGYASIRMTQKNYFGGAYMGCDISTGLGLPNWQDIFASYGLISRVLSLNDLDEPAFLVELENDQSVAYMISIHPEQTYFPKISSSIGENGQMISDPIHLMTPPLDSSIYKEVFRYN